MSDFLSADTEEARQLRDNLRALLASRSQANLLTALELLRAEGIPKAMLDDVLLTYFVSFDLDIRQRIQTLLLEHSSLSDFSKRYFKTYLVEPWITLSGTEKTIRQRLRKYLSRKELDFNPLYIAKQLFRYQRQGYFYILEEALPADKHGWLQQFLDGGELHLSGLSELFRLPTELSWFTELEGLHLRGCNFRVFPKVLLQFPFSRLKFVDLRQNPLQQIPAKAFDKLPQCTFLIG